MSKIVQILIEPESATHASALLGLGNDGVVYIYESHSQSWKVYAHAHLFERRPVDAAGGESADCPECDGTGNATFHPDDKCGDCKGTGNAIVGNELTSNVVPCHCVAASAIAGLYVSPFGTPLELIPEGAEEFVSDGFRALRFEHPRLGPVEVRIEGNTGWHVRHQFPGHETMIGWFGTHEPWLPHRWISYWLPRADEPIERTAEESSPVDKDSLTASEARAPDATVQTISEELERGGPWLGAAREWAKWHVRGGDSLQWDSREDVRIPFAELWEMARNVAEAAIIDERKARARETLDIRDRWKLEQQVEHLQSEVTRLTAEIERERAKVRENQAEIERLALSRRSAAQTLRDLVPAQNNGPKTLEQHVGDASSYIASLQSEVTRLTAAYTALRSSVEDLRAEPKPNCRRCNDCTTVASADEYSQCFARIPCPSCQQGKNHETK